MSAVGSLPCAGIEAAEVDAAASLLAEGYSPTLSVPGWRPDSLRAMVAGSNSPTSMGLLDPVSADWLSCLNGDARDAAVERLHELLLKGARREVQRRSDGRNVTGPELDDLAFQAAADALVSVLAKLNQFRGESRFTTWAYKFVMFEVSRKLARHFWSRADTSHSPVDWSRLEARFGLHPEENSEARDLLHALMRAVNDTLTERQRQVFVAIVVEGVPLDALVDQLGGSRNSIYKNLFDARQRLRSALVAGGYLIQEGAEA